MPAITFSPGFGLSFFNGAAMLSAALVCSTAVSALSAAACSQGSAVFIGAF